MTVRFLATGRNNYGQCIVSEWENIVAVSAALFHTVGLKSDGTVVAVGSYDNGKCDVTGWKLFDGEEGIDCCLKQQAELDKFRSDLAKQNAE